MRDSNALAALALHSSSSKKLASYLSSQLPPFHPSHPPQPQVSIIFLLILHVRFQVYRSFASCCIDSPSIVVVAIVFSSSCLPFEYPLKHLRNTMKYAVAVVALAAAVSAQTPPGCSLNFDGTFEISPANVSLSNKRAVLENVGCRVFHSLFITDNIFSERHALILLSRP